MRKALMTFVLCLALECCARGQGQVVWDESTHGMLGNAPETATSLGILSPVTNTLIGTALIEPTGPNWLVHEDVFRFSVPAGFHLSEIALSIDRSNVGIWFGTSDFFSTLGYQGNSLNGSLLAQYGAAGFESGTYGMYVANHNYLATPSLAHYRLDFVVTPVPEPAAWALLALGGAGLWAMRRHGRKP